MAVDTPARIAVLGAGPIGLETALYARYLGYEVQVFERGRVAEHVLDWGHVRMFSPFALNRSPLGLAALSAQNADYRPPSDDQLLTGHAWAEQYLIPLSQTDLLADHIAEQTTVVAVNRRGMLEQELPANEDRDDQPLRVLVRDRNGQERTEDFDVVIDTTGVFGNANWIGPGGVPAIGEAAVRERIEYRLPEIAGRARPRYAGRHTLVVGSGHSAATNVVALARLAEETPGTRITWLSRRSVSLDSTGPIKVISGDRLAARSELARQANQLAGGSSAHVSYRPGTSVEAVAWNDDHFDVRLTREHAAALQCDNIIANVGFRGDDRIYAKLHVHEVYSTGEPPELAEARPSAPSADSREQSSCGTASLLNSEPSFYLLGAKSYGRNSSFLVADGLRQIRDVFSILGDRENLDLYASMAKLLT